MQVRYTDRPLAACHRACATGREARPPRRASEEPLLEPYRLHEAEGQSTSFSLSAGKLAVAANGGGAGAAPPARGSGGGRPRGHAPGPGDEPRRPRSQEERVVLAASLAPVAMEAT